MERPKSWLTIIADAIERGGSFTDQDKAEAASWATCAVGEMRSSRTIYVEHGGLETQPSRFMRASLPGPTEAIDDETTPYWWLELNHFGPSTYSELDHHGTRFYEAVLIDRPDKALRHYQQIQELWPTEGKNEKKYSR